jgi:hypothetical protein
VIGIVRTGGEGGIRTLDTGFGPYNGLANRRLQPLGHLSAACFHQSTTCPSVQLPDYCSTEVGETASKPRPSVPAAARFGVDAIVIRIGRSARYLLIESRWLGRRPSDLICWCRAKASLRSWAAGPLTTSPVLSVEECLSTGAVVIRLASQQQPTRAGVSSCGSTSFYCPPHPCRLFVESSLSQGVNGVPNQALKHLDRLFTLG